MYDCIGKIKAIRYKIPNELFIFDKRNSTKIIAKKDSIEKLKKIISREKINYYNYDGFPLEDLKITLTLRCNLNCLHCSRSAPQQKDIPLNKLKKIFAEYRDIGGLRVSLTGGEVLMRKDFFDILDSANKQDLAITLNTNATLLTNTIIQKLKGFNISLFEISLDGSFAQIHDKLRNKEGVFEKATYSINKLLDNNFEVEVLTVMHKEVLKTLNNMLVFLENTGIQKWFLLELCKRGKCLDNYKVLSPPLKDLIFSLKNLNQFHDATKSKVQLDGYLVNYLRTKEKFLEPPCTNFDRYLAIDETGEVKPNPLLNLYSGSIYSESIKNIWESEKTQNVKNMELKKRCVYCYINNLCHYYNSLM